MATARAQISVVIPARDADRTIAAALRSLEPDAPLIGEVIVVDDGSIDETADVAEKTGAECGLTVVIIETCGRGAGVARNAGLERSQCPFVFFLDADDRIMPGALTLLHELLLEEPDAGLSAGASLDIAFGSKTQKRVPIASSDDLGRDVREYLVETRPAIVVGSVLIRRDRIKETRFPEDAVYDEDTCFLAALMSRERVVATSETVLCYRRDEYRTRWRLAAKPRGDFVAFARALKRLSRSVPAIDRETVRRRMAIVAKGIVAELLRQRRNTEARRLLRFMWRYPQEKRRFQRFRYLARALYRSEAPKPRLLPAGEREFRTLILTVDPAWPPVSGADLRNAENAKAAARLGPVLLVSVNPLLSCESPPEGMRAASLEGSEGSDADRLIALADAFSPDVVIVEGVDLVRFMPGLRECCGLLVLDMHNVESVLAGQIQRADPTRSLTAILGRKRRALSRLERDALSRADRIWVCSSHDAARLYQQHHPACPIDVLPNGIPRPESVPRMLPERSERQDGPTMLFFGHLDYRPNRPAARRLAEEILPAVQRELPHAHLVLAGRSPHRDVRALAEIPGVRVLADPPDADTVLRAADIVAVPLVVGGGTRLKVLEAMAWGLPVVATMTAVDGLALEAGEDFLHAESDEDFAREVVQVWTDRGRFEALRSRARETVYRGFGPAAIARAVRKGLGLRQFTGANCDSEKP